MGDYSPPNRSDRRYFLSVSGFDEMQSPKRPVRPTWIKAYVTDLDDPTHLSQSIAVRGFMSEFAKLAASLQNRVPDEKQFIANRLRIKPHIVGKLLSTCIQLGFVSRFAQDMKTNKNIDLAKIIDTRPIPPSYSHSKSSSTQSESTTNNGVQSAGGADPWQEIDEMDIPF